MFSPYPSPQVLYRTLLANPITNREVLGALQLRVLLHQLLQAEARKLYSNLGFFAFSFPLVDRSFSILRMANFLAGTESALTGGLFWKRFRDREFLAAAGEELGDVLDGIVRLRWNRGLLAGCPDAGTLPGRALIFVFVGIVN